MTNPAPLSKRVYEAAHRMWAGDPRGPEPKLEDFAHHDDDATSRPPQQAMSQASGATESGQQTARSDGDDLDARVRASLATMQAEFPTIRRD